MQYSNSKIALTMISLNQEGPPISSLLRSKLYINDRNPNNLMTHHALKLEDIPFIIDSSASETLMSTGRKLTQTLPE